MKNKLMRLVFSVVMAAMLLAPAGLAFGDAGGFSGGSDFSSSPSFGGGSSSGWGSSGPVIIYGGSGGGSSDDDSDMSMGEVLVCAVLFLVVCYFMFGRGGGNGGSGGSGGGGIPVRIEDSFDKGKVKDLRSLKARDPGFSESEMQESVANLYTRMQNAWTDKDFEPMRPYFSDGLYAQFNRQLQQLVRAGQTNYVDRIAVLGVDLQGWYEDGGQECLVCQVRTRIVDYTVDDASGRLVSGARDKERFMTYRWILSRPAGTASGTAMHQINCPNCGGVVDVNKSARCPYCDSMLKVDQHDWVISAIQGLAQQTR